MQFLIALALALTTLFEISLQRTYARIPANELRRRARAGDALAAALYKAVAYGHSLRAVLWVLIGMAAGSFFVYVTSIWPAWIAILASGTLIWFGFVWLPAGEATTLGKKLAGMVAPALAKLLSYLHRPIDWAVGQIRRFRHLPTHTGLYEKADLLDLLEQQLGQTDNRIEQTELEIMRSTLVFGDRLIGDVMTPRRVVKMVSVDDDLGPVVMDELHSSGHSRFPVYEGNEDNIVGLLFLRDLIKRRSGGKVRNIMKRQALYLHEDQSLYDALQAILKTHHHLFVVVNTFEEYVGIITIEDVLEQIVGQQIMDEFDQYEDLRAVAARTAQKEHQEHIEEEVAVREDDDGPEPKKTEPPIEKAEKFDPKPKKEPEVDEVIEV